MAIDSAKLEIARQRAWHYCQTDMVPKQYRGKPENGAVAIMWGGEIGLDPLQSLNQIAVINGSPALWGDALGALVLSSAVCEYVYSEWDAETLTATYTTKRKGQEKEQLRKYSLEDAKRAGLASRDTYKNHPEAMIRARARTALLRDVYPDVLKGIKSAEVEQENHEVYGEGYSNAGKVGAAAEKDITAKGETLTNIFKNATAGNADIPKAQSQPEAIKDEKVVTEVPKTETTETQKAAPVENDSGLFYVYKQRVERSQSGEELSKVGASLNDETNLTEIEVSKLRDIYMIKIGDFQAS